MNTLPRTAGGGFLAVVCVILSAVLTTVEPKQSTAQQAPVTAEKTYVGTTKCAACHFPKYKMWLKDGHAKSFEILPEKYKQDAGCLKCHTTGHGKPSGYKDASTAHLAGTTCEACHGPGSAHVKIALGFLKEEITPEVETRLKDAIMKNQPGNVCTTCHTSKSHGEPHPEYDKELKQNAPPRST